MRRLLFYIFVILIISMLVTACTRSVESEPIASYPIITPIAQYPANILVVYHAFVELTVPNVDKAANRATSLSYDFGGFLVSSNSWYTDGDKATTLVLAVPTQYFERLRYELLKMGDLVSESVSGKLANPVDPYSHKEFSHITVQLRPTSRWKPPIILTGWDPLKTLQSAFSVFITIFGFLANIIIWVVVVVGPFAVSAIVVRWLVLRLRRTP